MDEFETVERPTPQRSGRFGGLRAALRATAESGKALRLPLRQHSYVCNLYRDLRPYRVHTQREKGGDFFLAWATRNEPGDA